MKKLIITLNVVLSPIFMLAQVGINTDNPDATLDVNGNAKIRSVNEVENLVDHKILVINEKTSEVVKIDQSLVNNSSSTGNIIISNITKAKTSDTSALLDLNFYSGWDRISYTPDADFNSNFNPTNSTYTVPADGVYQINFQYRFGNGVQLQLLSFNGTPRIGILKHDAANDYTILDEKEFAGVSVNLALLSALSILISNTDINSFYKLKKGDILSFEFYKGGISADLLGDSTSNIQIYKISD